MVCALGAGSCNVAAAERKRSQASAQGGKKRPCRAGAGTLRRDWSLLFWEPSHLARSPRPTSHRPLTSSIARTAAVRAGAVSAGRRMRARELVVRQSLAKAQRHHLPTAASPARRGLPAGGVWRVLELRASLLARVDKNVGMLFAGAPTASGTLLPAVVPSCTIGAEGGGRAGRRNTAQNTAQILRARVAY